VIEVLCDLVSKASNHIENITLFNALMQCINSLIFHADDAVLMGKWSHQWSDLLTIETSVVLDDAKFLKALG
jgi:hypothetical protein